MKTFNEFAHSVNEMKKMSRKALAKKVEDGDAEINAYSMSDNVVDVTFYKKMNFFKRENIALTGKWPEGWGDE